MRAAILGGVAFSRNNNSLNLEAAENAQLTTPTRPRPARPPLQSPLQPRDHNAMMRGPRKASAPLTVKSGNANMPSSYDKQHTGARPLMPTLGAAAKTSSRTPLTPRVPGSAPAGVSTPLPRRAARPENNTPASSSREDLSTPISSFLSNNITPRSGSRKSRVDSANSTPTGTPSGTPGPNPFTHEPSRATYDTSAYGSGLGIVGIDKDVPKRPTVSFSPTVSDTGYSRSPVPSTAGDSKFFFANDAKSAAQPSSHGSRPPLQSKSSTFFYANGDSIQPPASSATSAVGSTVGEEKANPKFFHANGSFDHQPSPPPHFPPPRPSSTVSTSSRVTAPRLPTSSSGVLSPPLRPLSPTKNSQHAPPSSWRGAPSQPSPAIPRSHSTLRGQTANSAVAARRVSIENAQRAMNHGRSSSGGSPGSISHSRRRSSGSSFEVSAPSTPTDFMTTSVPVSTPEEMPEAAESPKEDVLSEPLSPSKAGNSIEHMNELAANARRERKVLDLEITNSSLAAINRTLEREMRKQTAELRRYRRLSRSGRLSIATTASIHTSMGSISNLEGVGAAEMSDVSEEESEEDEDYDSSEDESTDDASLSPRAMAQSDLRHRKRDELRLQLDLSKHQQLLIDSQKMNQSLKRCLGWTEELINEGRKALEYHVRVSDIELGGRVLVPDEIEDGENEGMSDFGGRLLKEARKAARPWAGTWNGDRSDNMENGDAQGEREHEHEQYPSAYHA